MAINQDLPLCIELLISSTSWWRSHCASDSRQIPPIPADQTSHPLQQTLDDYLIVTGDKDYTVGGFSRKLICPAHPAIT